jgi:hypothetical protein
MNANASERDRDTVEHLSAVGRLGGGEGPPHEIVAEDGVLRQSTGDYKRGKSAAAFISPGRHGGACPPCGRGSAARRSGLRGVSRAREGQGHPSGLRGVGGEREGQVRRGPAPRIRRPQLGGSRGAAGS